MERRPHSNSRSSQLGPSFQTAQTSSAMWPGQKVLCDHLASRLCPADSVDPWALGKQRDRTVRVEVASERGGRSRSSERCFISSTAPQAKPGLELVALSAASSHPASPIDPTQSTAENSWGQLWRPPLKSPTGRTSRIPCCCRQSTCEWCGRTRLSPRPDLRATPLSNTPGLQDSSPATLSFQSQEPKLLLRKPQSHGSGRRDQPISTKLWATVCRAPAAPPSYRL